MVLVAVFITLAALPLAGALDTAMHDARARAYAEQALTRHSQTATATGASYTTDDRDPATTVAPVRWQVGATQQNGEIAVYHTVKAGDPEWNRELRCWLTTAALNSRKHAYVTGWSPRSSFEANTAAWVRRCIPSLASSRDT